MEYTVEFLSFFVIQMEGAEPNSGKHFKHYQTLDRETYAGSEIKHFLDGEFARISKRKVEKHPNTEQAPTKIGRFIVEPGYELGSNPNYALFNRLRTEQSRDYFASYADELVRMYMSTNSVRGGALIIAQARAERVSSEPFVFVMKCDFEQKIARISDEQSLVRQVEMAISAKNIKSIQFPHMPEEGMVEEWELKIHQASHARYFEDFLKFVSYEKSLPELINHQVMDMVQEYMVQKWEGQSQTEDQPFLSAESEEVEHSTVTDSDFEHLAPQTGLSGRMQRYSPEEREREAKEIELWACSDKRELQEKWTPEQVVDAAQRLTEEKPELELKFKLDDITVKARLADFGDRLHIARHNGRYVVLIEGDAFEFAKGFSPIELLHPEELDQVVLKIGEKERDT